MGLIAGTLLSDILGDRYDASWDGSFVGAGFERLELSARLRYERNRSLAPDVGVNWERKLGGTADLAQAAGEGVSGVSAVFGVRAMF